MGKFCQENKVVTQKRILESGELKVPEKATDALYWSDSHEGEHKWADSR